MENGSFKIRRLKLNEINEERTNQAEKRRESIYKEIEY